MSLIDENGVSVWDADCSIIPEQSKEHQYMIMTYKGKQKFLWTYWDITRALSSGVETFLKDCKIQDATKEQSDELKLFFEHWIVLVKNEGNISSLL